MGDSPSPMPPRGPLQGLADLNDQIAGARRPDASAFVRGLVVGALVGAAIAGSTILRRRLTGRRPPDDGDPPAS
jgi:hypothetical protein